MQIYYLPDQRTVEADNVSTLLNASLEAGIPHTHVCGGNARCSTCRVMILEGQEYCAPRTSAEQELATQLQFEPGVRLACQTVIAQNGKIVLRRLSLDAEDMALFFDQATGKITTRMLGQEKSIAILFADIRGFTAFAEALPPYDVIYVLNRYFQRMAQVINRHAGTINVYMGDGLMALFGVENPERAVERAVRAGVEMLTVVEDLNPSLEMLYQRRLEIGIGIHYGGTVIGTIGDPKSPKMTAIGDAVNLASRIEAANKTLGTKLLISEEAYQETQTQVVVGDRFNVQLPGKSGEYCLYEVQDVIPSPAYDATLALKLTVPVPAHPPSSRRWRTSLWNLIQKIF
ncbi:MAG: adenylate/guanylate cyclase domain-containing protein [Oscillatoriales cyanobacterium C42_A2020_001]|nr:adenylate/guanylate cyclase domain-containing protein [Leptolyngbyaceae cyanobacterium C42_A2020_001]